MVTDIGMVNALEKTSYEVKKTYVIEAVNLKASKRYLFLKRLFDICFSLSIGIICMPVMLVIALMVRLSSPGTVLYKQERLGINGKKFNILKFRTMREDAEANGAQWAKKDDDRCTRLGAKLRKYRLDELPQLWNILIGDMSFVGPRPERECFYEEFETYIHGFSNRLAVVPGLTGLAQVCGGYDLLPEEKIVYDMEYIKQRSLWMDFKLICKTVMVILCSKGAR